MLSKSDSDWLKSLLKDLPFSQDFKTITASMKLVTLGDLLEIEMADLMRMPGFSYHFLRELVQFTEDMKITKLLKQ